MNRKCTDVFWLPVFALFSFGIFFACIYGWVNGNPAKLFVTFDAAGNACGYEHEDVKGFPNHGYVYWPEITFTTGNFAAILDRTVCVKECPSSTTDVTTTEFCAPNSIVTSCASTFRYDTSKYFGTLCFPQSGPEYGDKFRNEIMKYLGGNSYITRYMGDVVICWWVLLICAIIAFVLGFVYMLLVRCFAKIMVWVTIISVFFILVTIATILWFYKNQFASNESTYHVFLWTAVAIWILAGMYICLVLCCFRRIRLGVAII